MNFFRGSMAGLCVPLPTLRRCPRGQLRTARGRCGSLLLHRSRLALPTLCRSPGARAAKCNPGWGGGAYRDHSTPPLAL